MIKGVFYNRKKKKLLKHANKGVLMVCSGSSLVNDVVSLVALPEHTAKDVELLMLSSLMQSLITFRNHSLRHTLVARTFFV